MSSSDSESSASSHSKEYKTFRQTSRGRLLYEMLRSCRTEDSKAWKVLIMDKVTVKVMSCSCKMADITDEGISLVEDLFRRREPLPSMDAIYFIQPSKENLVMFLSDMSGREPLYRKAFIYFSSPVPKDMLARIKGDTSVLPRISALREMNLEYFAMDSQGYITDHDRALEDLFGEGAETSRKADMCLSTMATRIATVFASLKEFPFVRYRVKEDNSAEPKFRDLVCKKLATAVWETISTYKSTIPNFPKNETCELLILDRFIDQIAPVIHEWFYDAMCHDLLDMDGNKYTYEVPSKSGGEPEKKEVLLEDHDPVWFELRHNHIADASERLSDKMTNFMSKNKAAQLHQKDGEELSTRDLQKMVQSMPQYNEIKEKLSVHVEIAGQINQVIRDEGLRDLGQLEQDLVFGDAGSKEVINYFRSNQDASYEFKLRLMLIYAIVYPEKFEADKASKLMQLAKLSQDEAKVVKTLLSLEGADNKKASRGTFSLKFDSQKSKHAARKDKTGEEEQWQLFRFFPVLEELIEQLTKGSLPKNEYNCMNQTAPAAQKADTGGAQPVRAGKQSNPHSVRSRRTANWAKPRNSDDGYSSDSVIGNTSNDFKMMGQRIFIFIVGGATRSELRVCHKLTTKLRREIVLGSTSVDDPSNYIAKLKNLSGIGQH
ncbi:SNARE-interacting protein KEULE-like [Heracleum sosnowskyi]|uniref:SNARE-interacting protein KEULE-like n=1 Tax=Heracleum sosnowskyi TaxID=360622 RepID=A0AAD8I2Z6_9APIA|nr:SNARE-interacting protein KEULE-like [Heracleum sosnowskyi]